MRLSGFVVLLLDGMMIRACAATDGGGDVGCRGDSVVVAAVGK